ncbi:transposase [Roseiconus lacunae]|uniref:transposase n=1 Tax=Roseiconus lacunae TaxID=2605694 RepID=UPI0028F3EF81|nr:transposase [Roseiconus lacunae]
MGRETQTIHHHARAISEGSDVNAAKACLPELSGAQTEAVEAIAKDMIVACVKAPRETIPLAENKIARDRHNVMQLAAKAVDMVRRDVHRKLKSEGDNRLIHSRYVLTLCVAQDPRKPDLKRTCPFR